MRHRAGFAALILSGLIPACTVRAPGPAPPCPGLGDAPVTAARLIELAGGAPGGRPFRPPDVTAFLAHHFAAWQRHDEPRSVSRWAWTALARPGILNGTLHPLTREWLDGMDREAAWDRPDRLDRPGIALRTTSLRAMPTSHPLIEDPSIPGQGFAFDMLQNGLVDAGEPLWLSHCSASGRWVFVFTSFASGWILERDAAAIRPEAAEALRQMTPVAVVEEGFPVRSGAGRFLFSGRIGMILPSVGRDDGDGVRVLVPAGRDGNDQVLFETVTLGAGRAVPVPLDPTLAHLAALAAGMSGLPYGWGGLFEGRDCSSFVRDFFMPFGLWLPRNSRDQASAGRRIDLHGLDAAAKARRIVERGRPFATLLTKPGHVALYVGRDREGNPVILHGAWDLSVRVGGTAFRRHMGRIVLTTLRAAPPRGRNACAPTLLAELETMTLLER